ncbi:hypothetical protein [Streptomyces zhihengii]
MNQLPDQQQPAAGQHPVDPQAQQLIAAVEEALRTPTAYRDDTPVPAIGTTPPVPQPGRPPMSQRATDASALMLSGSVLTLAAGGAASGLLFASGYADPTTVALIAAAPIGLAAPILAISWVIKHAKAAAAALPAEQHHHYTGTVHQDQRTVNSTNLGLWASTRNHLTDGK